MNIRKWTRTPSFIRIVISGLAISGLLFLQDVIVEVWQHFQNGDAYDFGSVVHLTVEIFAIILLLSGMLILLDFISDLKVRQEQNLRKLEYLRESFDEHVQETFRKWELTPAESDVALFFLRGYSASDVAELRNSSTGTIKAHSHNIFRKSGVSSRVEFMSVFLDEFIGIGQESEIKDL